MIKKSIHFRVEKNKVIAVDDFFTHWDCVIPPVYNGEEIKAIDKSVFNGSSYLISISLPDTVEELEEEAFY